MGKDYSIVLYYTVVRTMDYLIIAQYGKDKCTGQTIFRKINKRIGLS